MEWVICWIWPGEDFLLIIDIFLIKFLDGNELMMWKILLGVSIFEYVICKILGTRVVEIKFPISGSAKMGNQ